MTRIGCSIWLLLLGVLLCAGGGSFFLRHASILAGVAAGLLAWFALLSGYAAVLTIVDWFHRHQRKEGIPMWGVALVWLTFIATTFCLFVVIQRLYSS